MFKKYSDLSIILLCLVVVIFFTFICISIQDTRTLNKIVAISDSIISQGCFSTLNTRETHQFTCDGFIVTIKRD